MATLDAILLITAVVLLSLRAFGIGPARPDLGWLGLAVLTLTFLV